MKLNVETTHVTDLQVFEECFLVKKDVFHLLSGNSINMYFSPTKKKKKEIGRNKLLILVLWEKKITESKQSVTKSDLIRHFFSYSGMLQATSETAL